ncbi:hypothetical protein HPB47_017235, partial [Ixodes persulcatus]
MDTKRNGSGEATELKTTNHRHPVIERIDSGAPAVRTAPTVDEIQTGTIAGLPECLEGGHAHAPPSRPTPPILEDGEREHAPPAVPPSPPGRAPDSPETSSTQREASSVSRPIPMPVERIVPSHKLKSTQPPGAQPDRRSWQSEPNFACANTCSSWHTSAHSDLVERVQTGAGCTTYAKSFPKDNILIGDLQTAAPNDSNLPTSFGESSRKNDSTPDLTWASRHAALDWTLFNDPVGSDHLPIFIKLSNALRPTPFKRTSKVVKWDRYRELLNGWDDPDTSPDLVVALLKAAKDQATTTTQTDPDKPHAEPPPPQSWGSRLTALIWYREHGKTLRLRERLDTATADAKKYCQSPGTTCYSPEVSVHRAHTSDAPFKLAETQDALDHSNMRSAQGPDGVTQSELRNLPTEYKLKILEWMNEEDRLHHCQTGFRSDLSTQDNVLMLHHDVLADPSSIQPKTIVAVDVQKAFDSVPHSSVIESAKLMGIQGRALNVTRNFLKDRGFQVKIGSSVGPEIINHVG